jgi:hemoglobin
MDDSRIPTLYAWLGGLPALEQLTTRFYERVKSDSILAPLFAHMGSDHPRHVALFLAEVLGGPSTYSEEPDDPEFRSALVGYLEWGSRLAVINSQAGAKVEEGSPMPKWGWGEVKGPYKS